MKKQEINFSQSVSVATSFIFAVMFGNIPSYIAKGLNLSNGYFQISSLVLGKVKKSITWFDQWNKNTILSERYILVKDQHGDTRAIVKLEKKEVNNGESFSTKGWRVVEASFYTSGEWHKISSIYSIVIDSQLPEYGWAPEYPAIAPSEHVAVWGGTEENLLKELDEISS